MLYSCTRMATVGIKELRPFLQLVEIKESLVAGVSKSSSIKQQRFLTLDATRVRWDLIGGCRMGEFHSQPWSRDRKCLITKIHMTHKAVCDDHSRRRTVTMTSWQSSTTYWWARLCKDLKTRTASLNLIRWRTVLIHATIELLTLMTRTHCERSVLTLLRTKSTNDVSLHVNILLSNE